MNDIKEEGWNGRWAGHLLESEPILYAKYEINKYLIINFLTDHLCI